ncbi:MAG: flavin reductase family protein [Actinomycetota bacterium]|nr:flavin reductase family protein [Actinomycetota bacterium]
MAFRDAMARFPSGVTIVTTHDESGMPQGFTASSFCSVSAEPPLVLVCLAKSANCYPVFAHNDRFAISFLQADHVNLARRFASKSADKFACGGFVRTPRGATVLEEALAVVECSVYSRHEAGDHMIMVGEVEQVLLADRRSPAVYFDRAFSTICSSSCEQADSRRAVPR